ncbi:MAG TPA: UbiA family prenyltransferase [Candidatus Elarobacter sp.]|nr:UbiA family prenyltransferase [Candidatus Elarobacter sp.]
MILVRPRAWWFNKVPLSVTLVLLLLDGRRFSLGALAVITLVVLTVCAAGNYGYALNDLFDVEEDARLGRNNRAAGMPRLRMWAVIAASALCAEVCATVAAGRAGALLTLLELCLPLAYSVPPVRIKERAWLGIAADALAAHVYPAVLVLMAVTHWTVRPVTSVLAIAVVVWATAAGVRNILSHQLNTAEQDRKAGLRTVVHDLGNARLERGIVAGVLPIEVGAFGGAMIACNAGPVVWAFVALYLMYEAFKTCTGRFRVTVFRSGGQPYVPFIEESFYKAWGPLVFALDAARVDPVYLLVIPSYIALFRPHLRAEMSRLRAVVTTIRIKRATEPCGRSSGES